VDGVCGRGTVDADMVDAADEGVADRLILARVRR
jgi:hypothetical protein